MGTIGILNVGAGDTKLTCDPDNPADMIRFARIVRDMLRRGYALLVDSGEKDSQGRPRYVRARAFDESKCEYVIADLDPEGDDEPSFEPPATESPAPPVPKERGRRGRLPAATTNAVAVPRSAGG